MLMVMVQKDAMRSNGTAPIAAAMPSTPPPEPLRRRRRSDSAARFEHRARPLPRPDFFVHRAQGGTAWVRCWSGYFFVSMSRHTTQSAPVIEAEALAVGAGQAASATV
ncbi:hypothetical protein OPR00_006465, partial [Pseudomonas aeruginosa]